MATSMEFGVMLSTFGERASLEAFRRIARVAERTGFDSIWVGDHIAIPVDVPDEYPFSPTGEAPPVFDAEKDVYEPFAVLSYLAGITESIDIGTNACVVPYRHPISLVKQVFTLEALSEGRFDFGVVPGWLRTEFEILDVPFDERGSRTDEFLELFDRARTEEVFAFEGEHHSFQETGFHPTPGTDRPKVWIGGRSPSTFRRVGEFGDGWTIFWDRPEDIASARTRILSAWEDYDRSGTPEIAVVRGLDVDPELDPESTKPFVGDPTSMLDDVEAYADAGASRIVVQTYADDLEERLEQIETFGTEVVGRL